MPIDANFHHEIAKFIIASRRNPLLKRWLGEADALVPEKSPQGIFEQTQAKILELPRLLDAAYDDAQLRLLAWCVGWDDTPAVSFIDDLSDSDMRKLIKLSVPLWREKGSSDGLVNAIRVFTGKTAIVQDWFWHRWVLDTSGFWAEAQGDDPYLVGFQYTEGDEYLTWIILNRQGLGEAERRLIYDLLTYVRVACEHYGVIYAAFADDFRNAFAQWTQIGTAGTLVSNANDFRGGLTEGAKIKTNFAATELATWTPFQRAIVHIEFAGASSTEVVSLEAMRNVSGSTYYRATLSADGTLTLSSSNGYSASTALVMPIAGTPLGLEVRVEPINAAETKVSILVGNTVLLTSTFLGVDALIDSEGGVTIARTGAEPVTTYIDNVVVLASPHQIQFIGQRAITPTSGLGGPQYIANPDPGLEPFAE